MALKHQTFFNTTVFVLNPSMVAVLTLALLYRCEAGGGIEHDSINVHLDYEKNALVTVLRSRCFILMLTESEMHDTTSSRGREDLEMKMIRDIMGFVREQPVSHSDSGLTGNMQQWCWARDIYLLMRNSAATPRTSSATPTYTAGQSKGSPNTTTGSSTNPTILPGQTTNPVILPGQTTNPVILPGQTTNPSILSGQTTNPAILPGQTLNPAILPGQTTNPVILPGQTTNPAILPGQTTNPAILPGQTTNPAILPGQTTIGTPPAVLYDRTLSLKAVVVTDSRCFVYRLTEVDRNLVNFGANGQGMFEQALLAKDLSLNGLAEITGNIGYMAKNIQNACVGNKVYILP